MRNFKNQTSHSFTSSHTSTCAGSSRRTRSLPRARPARSLLSLKSHSDSSVHEP